MRGRVFKRCACRDAETNKQLGASCPKLAGKRHGVWYFIADLAPDATGRRRQMKRGGFTTKGAAEKALEEVVGRVRRGERVDDRTTVSEWLTFWLAEKTKGQGASAAGKPIRPSTARSYRQHVEDYLVPQLGRIPLAKLTTEDISEAYDAILAERHMGATTLRRVHASLSSALAAAVKARRIGHNPAAHVTLPDAERPRVRPWEPAELGAFLDAVAGERLGSLFEVVASCGLRRGEALGLRWSDVDLEAGHIVVRQQLANVKNAAPIFARPKTKAGEHRTVELDTHTLGVLVATQLMQGTERAAWGEAYVDHDLVFAREDGTPYEPTFVTKAFRALAVKAGLRPVRLHDLRHGAASLRLAAGVPIELVSKLLGHSGIGITLDTYSHLLEGVGRQAAEAAMSLVPRATNDPRGHLRDHDVTTSADEAGFSGSVEDGKQALTSNDASGPPGDRTQNPRIKRILRGMSGGDD